MTTLRREERYAAPWWHDKNDLLMHIEDSIRSGEMAEYNARENATKKIAIAMEYKSLQKRIEDLEWWIQVLTAMNTDLSHFGDEVAILKQQIDVWQREDKAQRRYLRFLKERVKADMRAEVDTEYAIWEDLSDEQKAVWYENEECAG